MITLLQILSNINVMFYILAFVAGGIPFGLLIARVFSGVNILKFGSGSTGATNVYRLFESRGNRYASLFSALTILLDASKGLLVVALAKFFGLSYAVQWGVSIISILGHCYSPFLGFSGGRGVSVAIGSVLLLIPLEGILGLFVWGLVGKTVKISSVSSLIGVSSGIGFTFIFPYLLDLPESINIVKQVDSHVPVIVIWMLIIYTHTDNIVRLLKGDEKKLNL